MVSTASKGLIDFYFLFLIFTIVKTNAYFLTVDNINTSEPNNNYEELKNVITNLN